MTKMKNIKIPQHLNSSTIHSENNIDRRIKIALTHIHDLPLSWLGTHPSIKSVVSYSTFMGKTSHLSERMRFCKCFPHLGKTVIIVS